MIPKETVDEILETSRVEEVVSEHVNLKKRGANLLGLCPFHNEKTPSFTVSPAKGIYKCFGCGKAGSSVNFLMDHEHYTYPEALRFLANKYNIEIEEEELSAEDIQKGNERESLFLISQFAAEYFKEQLHETEDGKAIALSYFKERELRDDIIEKFGLGYNPDDWSAFTKTALDKGYNLDYLEKTGLTIVKGEKQFDRFKGRVMFPIHNVSGRVIAFGGRTLLADKKVAKYLNSPESDIYHKSRVLYGLYFAKKQIIASDNCYLVEGYTDVIRLHQSGIENVVASSGTSLTVDQIRLIKRYTSNITVLFDGDAAGIKAAFRGIDMILEEGLNVKVVTFPEGEDPDSFAQKNDAESLVNYLNNESTDFIRFKTQILLEEVGNDPIKRAGLIKDIVSSIALIPDPIARSVYIQECSNLLDIDEKALLLELNKIRRNKLNKKLSQSQEPQEIPVPDYVETPEPKADMSFKSTETFQEEDVIKTLIKFGDKDITIDGEEGEKVTLNVSQYVIYEIEKDGLSFNNGLYQKIYGLFVEATQKGKVISESFLVANENQEISAFVIESLLDKYALSLNWEEKHNILTVQEADILEKKVHKGICSWRLNRVMTMIEERQEMLKSNAENYESLVKEIEGLITAKKALADELGRIVLK